MNNYINNNPFGQKIESAVSTGQNQKRKEQEKKEEERRYLEEEDNDEVALAPMPELTEEQVQYLINDFISKRKSEHSDNEKILQKLDKYLEKFDVKKFMKRNPHMTVGDFNMIIYNETANILN